jgi:hypothetical protein
MPNPYLAIDRQRIDDIEIKDINDNPPMPVLSTPIKKSKVNSRFKFDKKLTVTP